MMGSALGTEHKHQNMDDRLIPLINIVFLLLIFFMIAGQITYQQNQTIQPPLSHSEEKAELPEWLIEVDAAGSYRINGDDVSEQELKHQLADLADATGVRFTVKADRTLKAETLDRTLNILRSFGIAKLTLLSRYTVD